MIEILHPITGKPTGERLQLHQNAFEQKMDWITAKIRCKELGNGWRLPTKSELELIYADLKKKGSLDFKEDFYWSHTETSSLRVWVLHFGNGHIDHGFYKKDTAFFCAVRTV